MSDFNGKPLVFRDGVERQFWGRMLEAEFMRAPDGFARSSVVERADEVVIEMRIRQKEILNPEGTTARLYCAVCLNPSIVGGKPAPHTYDCPIGM